MIDPNRPPLTPQQEQVIQRELRHVFQKLNKHPFNFCAADVNAMAFGLITKSMESLVGKDQAREFLESSMNNVWGKKSIFKRIIGR